MYKLLLCWRYLRTRYIALASVISVTLGVATMIVVNSVMAGFTHEMQNRIHGILSDVVFDGHSLEGFHDPAWHMREIRRVAGKYISGMTPTVVVPAMLSFQSRGQWVTRQVNFIGVDEQTHSKVSDFSGFLQHPENRKHLSFDLRNGGYDEWDHQGEAGQKPRPQLPRSGWPRRRWQAEQAKRYAALMAPPVESVINDPFGERSTAAPASVPSASDGEPASEAAPAPTSDVSPAPDSNSNPAGQLQPSTDEVSPTPDEAQTPASSPAADPAPATVASSSADEEQKSNQSRTVNESGLNAPTGAGDPFRMGAAAEDEDVFDPARDQHSGIVLGISLASYRTSSGADSFLVLPGDDVKITLPTAGTPPKAVSDTFTIVDFYESKMSEYDSSFVFAPIEKVQQMRGMIDPSTGIGNVTSIQIKLYNDNDGPLVRDLLQKAFPGEIYGVQTWRDKQGPLLAAVQMETAILNVLLFLIIAVAGFGILAIFYMIVVEKTRDIGILKALGRIAAESWAFSWPMGCRWAWLARASAWCSGSFSCSTSTRSRTGWLGSPGTRSSIRRSITSKRFPPSWNRSRFFGS